MEFQKGNNNDKFFNKVCFPHHSSSLTGLLSVTMDCLCAFLMLITNNSPTASTYSTSQQSMSCSVLDRARGKYILGEYEGRNTSPGKMSWC